MRKIKILPIILLVVLCVGIVMVGIYAISFRSNSISGTLKVNSSAHEVYIEVYKNSETIGNKIGSTLVSRAGREIDLGDFSFNTTGINSIEEAKKIDIIIKITNRTTTPLGVYFWDGYGNIEDEVSLSHIVWGHRSVSGVGNVSGDTYTDMVDAEYSFYHHIPGYTEVGNVKTYYHEYMHVILSLEQLVNELTYVPLNFNLNVEEYTASENYSTSTTTPFVKLPTETASVPAYGNSVSVSANSQITHVVVPYGCAIASGTFQNCSGLVTVSLPKTLTAIASNVFDGCSAISSVVLGSVTSIGSGAFAGNVTLDKILIPSTVTTITTSTASDSPFYGCNRLALLYCAAASKPAGWDSYWNYSASETAITPMWSALG